MLTIQQVAEELRVSDKTVRRLIRRKRIKCVTIGYRTKRIRPADLEAFKERGAA